MKTQDNMTHHELAQELIRSVRINKLPRTHEEINQQIAHFNGLAGQLTAWNMYHALQECGSDDVHEE